MPESARGDRGIMNPLKNVGEMQFSEVLAAVKELDAAPPDSAVSYKIAFLRNITADPIVPYLKYLCYRDCLKASVYMADFNIIMQEAVNPESGLYVGKPDIIVVALLLELLSEPLSRRFAALNAEQIDGEKSRVIEFLEGVIINIRKNSRAAILVHSFETPPHPAFGILDFQSHDRQTGVIAAINSGLSEIASRAGNCYVVNMDSFAARLGSDRFADQRMWQVGKIPYTREAWKNLAAEYMKFIRALRGKNKKCLVLDCDNTLWGGIVGEDGPEGIKIGKTWPGSCYRDFQLEILNLYHRGVILAVCSRNNEQDVLDVLDRHPELELRREHFASMRINWKDKASNIIEIAEELNIGLDSMVFMDDSDMEVEMVGRLIPEVSAIHLPKDPSGYAGLLARCGLFDSLVHSEEDRNRGRMYRAEAQRKEFQKACDNVDDYLRSLEIRINISRADKFSLPRIVQLLHRTNQFNLTTRRHSEAVVSDFAGSSEYDVLSLQYEDRFGDMGIVGAAILLHGAEGSEIDSLLLSCRALGRKVEDLFLAECIRICRQRGKKHVTGIYAPTSKNMQVSDFYENRGFEKTETKDGASFFRFDSEKAAIAPPDIFKSVKVEI